MKINVAKDFSILPSGRHTSDGSYTGDHFYQILVDKLNTLPENEKIEINFDGVISVGSSFLNQSFVTLIRNKDLTRANFNSKITIVANEQPEIKEKIQRYISEV